MPAYDANGAVLAKAAIPSTAIPAPSGGDAKVRLTAPVYERRDLGIGRPGDLIGAGTKGKGAARHLKWAAGTVVTQREIDALYKETTISTIVPATGAAGTGFVITGTNLARATAVTVGGTPVTNFKVENDLTIRGVRPVGGTGAGCTVVVDGTTITKA